ncbi:MAG: hypothetical protein JXB07_11275 [Anaerolineae bacterium]|nr:hypothetical protein [Anaerolineae bacterium]
MWRHGDVLIDSIDAIPEGAEKHHNLVLAYGEITGHSHRIEDQTTAELWESNDGLLFLKVIASQATIVHEEHDPITLPQGLYRVWYQREYTPQAIRRVID